jgi:predicted regulator of Ras-like GTPase activity (Roadblock/LC7/MglB family)
MSNLKESMAKLMEVDGAVAVAIVDSSSGLVLGKEGSGFDLDLAGAGNTEVVRAKMKTMKSLNLNDRIEDILITLGKQYHIIRPIEKADGLFAYLVLLKDRANLALARRRVADVEAALVV